MINQGLGTSESLNNPEACGAGVTSPLSPPDTERWAMLTSNCAPPLPEDWCLRGMEWVGRKVYERGFWKSGEERKMENEYLDKTEAGHGETTDGHIEDDDDENQPGGAKESKPSNLNAQRWVRIVRCAVGIADAVDGLTWIEGTREWSVTGTLAEKVDMWKEQARIEMEDEERRRMGTRWTDDAMDIDDSEDIVSEGSSDEDDEDTEQVKALKV
jgi:hypothetical protein